MIVDYLELFTEIDGDKITGSQASKYAIDFEQASPTTGYDEGRPTAVFAITGKVGADVTISLQECDTVDGTFVDCAGGVTLTGGLEGMMAAIPVPVRHKRYLQAYFKMGRTGQGESVTTATPASTALIKGFITSGVQDNPGFEQAPELGKNY